MSKSRTSVLLISALFLLLSSTMSTLPTLAADPQPYTTGFKAWRAAEGALNLWQRDGLLLTSGGTLQLDTQTTRTATDPYRPGSYYGANFYNGGISSVGEALSPVMAAPFPFSQAIASWNAATPPGTWLETQIRVRIGSRWSKWYNLGVWAADTSIVKRHSVKGQTDADGTVSVDTLALGSRNKTVLADAYQVKLRLFTANRSALPSITNVSVALSTKPAVPRTLQPGNPASWGKKLGVPQCSQMVYRDGGEVWCSPTSLSMLLAYWQKASGPCEPHVRASVAGVYDTIYKGHGNWPFNTAYASTQGMEAYVARFTSLAQAESWIAAGVPVVISLGWNRGQLSGAPIASSSGHLALLVGFDKEGNPIVNDPAAPQDSSVTRTYPRAQLERLWLQHSGGTVYLAYPPGWSVPQL